MTRPRSAPARLAALGLAAALIPALSGGAHAAGGHAGGSLSVGPAVYQPGQRMHFTGQLPGGRQPVHLQSNMNRPGDVWTDVQGGQATSDATGHFSFYFPAPAMYGVSYRVVSAHGATPGKLFHARQPELSISATNARTGRAITGLGLGQHYVVNVDATEHTGLTGGAPAIPGRQITVQRRIDDDTWRTIATGTENARGQASFALTAPSSAQPLILRAVESDWFAHGNKIGWFASFPIPLSVGGAPLGLGSHSSRASTHRSVAPRTAAPTLARGRGTTNASQRYGWGPSLYDYAWEFGESIGSPAYRGTQLGAGWTDASDGLGRASHFNGGLKLDSSAGRRGDRDLGTTAATLDGTGVTSGRWEFRFRWIDIGSHPALIQLVRPGSDGTTCSAPITVADVDGVHRTISFGTTVGSKTYSTARSVSLGLDPHNLAVEWTPTHITWFIDSRPVATTSNHAAIPGGALTPRVSLQGSSHADTHSTVIYDWVRSWTLKAGHPATGGGQLHSTSADLGC